MPSIETGVHKLPKLKLYWLELVVEKVEIRRDLPTSLHSPNFRSPTRQCRQAKWLSLDA